MSETKQPRWSRTDTALLVWPPLLLQRKGKSVLIQYECELKLGAFEILVVVRSKMFGMEERRGSWSGRFGPWSQNLWVILWKE